MHTIPVKYVFGGPSAVSQCHSQAPVISSVSNCVINVLDAVLCNGFGETLISSLVVVNGIATATCASHGFQTTPIVILVSRCDQEAINGEWELTSYTPTTLVFDVTESGITDATITGASIKIKIAPLGWRKPFPDTGGIAVYRSNHPLSRRAFLRVDDTDNATTSGVKMCFFRGFEAMTSNNDNGTYPFPNKVDFSRGVGGAIKEMVTSNADWSISSNISWTIVGTSRQFYFFWANNYQLNAPRRGYSFFGDLISYIPGDYGATGLLGVYNPTTIYNYQLQFFSDYNSAPGFYVPRTCQKTHTINTQRCIAFITSQQSGIFGINVASSNQINDPDILSNRFFVYRPIFFSDETILGSIRGEIPGLAIPVNRMSTATNKLLPNTFVKVKNERFMVQPIYKNSATFRTMLLSIDRDWNEPIL